MVQANLAVCVSRLDKIYFASHRQTLAEPHKIVELSSSGGAPFRLAYASLLTTMRFAPPDR